MNSCLFFAWIGCPNIPVYSASLFPRLGIFFQLQYATTLHYESNMNAVLYPYCRQFPSLPCPFLSQAWTTAISPSETQAIVVFMNPANQANLTLTTNVADWASLLQQLYPNLRGQARHLLIQNTQVYVAYYCDNLGTPCTQVSFIYLRATLFIQFCRLLPLYLLPTQVPKAMEVY